MTVSRLTQHFERVGYAVWIWGIAGLVVFLGRPVAAFAQEPISVTDSWFDPPAYVVYRTEEALKIDGTFDENVWNRVEWTASFVDIRGEETSSPRFATRAKMLWNKDYFFIAAELEEPDVWATLSERDVIVWKDDAFEVFIDPSGDTHSYYELQVNALETVRDLFLVKPFRDGGPAIGAWNIRDIQVGVDIKGTLNNPSDRDQGWTVELALPWEILAEAASEGRPPHSGEQWRVNFARPDWSLRVVDGAYKKEKGGSTDWWVWAPQGTVNMHKPERFGYVQFVEERAGEEAVAFTEDPNKRLKWALRQLYYRQREYQKVHGRYATDLSDLNAGEIAVEDRDFRPTLNTTQSMFEITAPGTNGTILHIRHDGKVWRTSE